jgi:hypothetical protein
VEAVTRWLKIGRLAGGDIHKVILEALAHKPYSLVSIFVVLGDAE